MADFQDFRFWWSSCFLLPDANWAEEAVQQVWKLNQKLTWTCCHDIKIKHGKIMILQTTLATRKNFFFLHGEEWNLRVKHQVLVEVKASRFLKSENLIGTLCMHSVTLSASAWQLCHMEPYDRHKTKASYSLLSLQVHKWKMKAKEAQLLSETSNLCQNPGCWWHHREGFRAWVLRSYTRAWNLTSMCTMLDL